MIVGPDYYTSKMVDEWKWIEPQHIFLVDLELMIQLPNVCSLLLIAIRISMFVNLSHKLDSAHDENLSL